MEQSSVSISNPLSKISLYEEMSISRASMEDAAALALNGKTQQAISNEQIHMGDELLSTYTVLSEPRSGGMGSVWKTHHKNWNVDLAMKRPQPQFFAEAGRSKKAAFVTECENWINLGLHPNIVSCYYVREIGGVPTIFSEWMERGSLSDNISDGSLYKGTPDEVQERFLDIFIQAARGLRYSHEQGLFHQDIKPGNLLLTSTWETKVADFGLAKARRQLAGKEQPQTRQPQTIQAGSSTGAATNPSLTGYTLAYCPKEQSEGADPEAWMDVYALALTVLEMYCKGRFWRKGSENQRICELAESKCIIPPPQDLLRLIKHCLLDKENDASAIERLLLNIYSDTVGKTHERLSIEELMQPAGDLNNRALSMLDLGKPEQARKLWQLASEQNSRHKETVFNYSLFQWRNAEITDLDVLYQIERQIDANERDTFKKEIYQERNSDKLVVEKEAIKTVYQENNSIPEMTPDINNYVTPQIKDTCTEILGKSPVFEADETYIYAAASAKIIKTETAVWIIDPETGKCSRMDVSLNPINGFKMNKQGTVLAIYNYEELQAYSVPEGKLLFTAPVSEKSLLDRGVLSDDGNWLAVHHSGVIEIRRLTDGRCMKTIYPETKYVYNGLNGNPVLGISFPGDDLTLDVTLHGMICTIPNGPFEYLAPWHLCRISTVDDTAQTKRLFIKNMEEASLAEEAGDHRLALKKITEGRKLPGYEYNEDALALKRKVMRNCTPCKVSDVWELATIRPPEAEPFCAAIVGRDIFIHSKENIYQYTVSGRCVEKIRSFLKEPRSIDVSYDGRYLIAAGYDAKKVAIHDLEKHSLKTIDLQVYPETVSFSTDAAYFCINETETHLKIYSFPDCVLIKDMELSPKRIAARWSKDSSALYCMSEDTLWTVFLEKDQVVNVTEKAVQKSDTDMTYGTRKFCDISPDGKYALSVVDRTSLDCLDAQTGEVRTTIFRPEYFASSAFISDSLFFAFGTNSGHLEIYNSQTLTEQPGQIYCPNADFGQLRWNRDYSILSALSQPWSKEREDETILHLYYVDWAAAEEEDVFQPYLGNEGFICTCYMPKQFDTVSPLLTELHNRGYRVWHYGNGGIGRDYMINRMTECEFILVFMSQEASDNNDFREIVYYGSNCRKRVAVITIDDYKLAPILALRMHRFPVIKMSQFASVKELADHLKKYLPQS